MNSPDMILMETKQEYLEKITKISKNLSPKLSLSIALFIKLESYFLIVQSFLKV